MIGRFDILGLPLVEGLCLALTGCDREASSKATAVCLGNSAAISQVRSEIERTGRIKRLAFFDDSRAVQADLMAMDRKTTATDRFAWRLVGPSGGF